MAHFQHASVPISSTEIHAPSPIKCKASNNVEIHSQTILRRSANFQPSIWHDDYIQSLSNEYKNESYVEQRRLLKKEVKSMLCKVVNHLDQLEMIDVLQRLGVAYHFKDEIKNMLDNIYNMEAFKGENNLHATALKFRLLRQHGYDISTDVFDCFCEGTNNFKEYQSINVEGVLSLYEASFHSVGDEIILDDAKNFTSKFLEEYVNKSNGSYIFLLINHALEFPLYWRMPRWEAHWFIKVYERSHNMCPALLRFAKLDFNMLQSIYQEELKDASRWWKTVGLADKLSSRDRLVEGYFAGVGMNFGPDLGYFRRVITKVNGLITTIDDIYDAYGKLDELELFTEAIDRWDLDAMKSLPMYMKICFLALYNFVNEVAFETLKENGNLIIPYLRKSWTDLCKTYFKEAKWYHSGHTPNFGEYMERAWVSIGAPVILVHAYFLVPNPSKMEDLFILDEYPNLIRFSSMLLRLANDLGTSQRESETGDVPKAVECYMNETGASETDAREHVKRMIYSTWKMMNKEVRNSTCNQSFLDIVENVPTTALFYYQYEDGYTTQDPETTSRLSSLIMQPIPVEDSDKIVEK